MTLLRLLWGYRRDQVLYRTWAHPTPWLYRAQIALYVTLVSIIIWAWMMLVGSSHVAVAIVNVVSVVGVIVTTILAVLANTRGPQTFNEHFPTGPGIVMAMASGTLLIWTAIAFGHWPGAACGGTLVTGALVILGLWLRRAISIVRKARDKLGAD